MLKKEYRLLWVLLVSWLCYLASLASYQLLPSQANRFPARRRQSGVRGDVVESLSLWAETFVKVISERRVFLPTASWCQKKNDLSWFSLTKDTKNKWQNHSHPRYSAPVKQLHIERATLFSQVTLTSESLDLALNFGLTYIKGPCSCGGSGEIAQYLKYRSTGNGPICWIIR